jgi:nicotinate phosphoribosyltransferase
VLLKSLVEAGKIVGRTTPAESQAFHQKVRDELPRSASQLSRGEPVIPTEYEGDYDARNPFHPRSHT